MRLRQAGQQILGAPALPGISKEHFRVTAGFVGLVAYLWIIHSNKVALGAIAIGLGLLGVLVQRERLRFPTQLVLFGAYLAWASLTSRWSMDPVSTPEALTDLAKLWLISLVACNVAQTRRQLQMLMIAWLGIFALYPVRGTFFNFLHGIQIWGRYAWNFIFYNPNDLAALTLPILALSIAVLQGERTRGWVRLSALAGVVALPVLIFLTQSRGGILALVTLALLVLVQYRRRAKALAIFVVVAGVIALAAPTSVWDRLRGLEKATSEAALVNVDEEGSANQRFQIWKVAAAMVADHPVTGVGLGAYPRANRLYVRKDRLNFDQTARGLRDTHSIYLNVAAETGVVGLLVFLGMIGSVLWQGQLAVKELSKRDPDASKQIQTLLIGLIAFLQAGIFTSLQRVAFLYLYLGLITSAIAILCAHARVAALRQPETQRGPLPRGLPAPAEPPPTRRPALAPQPLRPSVYPRSR